MRSVCRSIDIGVLEKVKPLVSLIAFILGAIPWIRISIGGKLGLNELLITLAGPVYILVNWRYFSMIRGAKLIGGLGALWFGFQVVSDIVNHTPFQDYARGWANVGMTILLFIFFVTFLAKNPKAFRPLLYGLILGGLCKVIFLRGYDDLLENSQFGDLYVAAWGNPLVWLVCWRVYTKHRMLAVAILMFYGMAMIALNARSTGMVAVIAGCVLFYLIRSAQTGYRLTFSDAARFIAIITPIMALLFCSLVYLGLHGDLGQDTQKQFRSLRQPYNPIFIIGAARSAFPVAVVAVKDAPLLGHGSWAKDSHYVYVNARIIQYLTGSPPKIINTDTPQLIPSHSAILGAWVNGGIAGGIMWIAVTVIAVRLLIFYMKRTNLPMLPIFVYWLLMLFWDLGLSPIGKMRSEWPYMFAIALVMRHYILVQESYQYQLALATSAPYHPDQLNDPRWAPAT